MTIEEYIIVINDVVGGMKNDGHLVDLKAEALANSIKYNAKKLKERFEEIESEETRKDIDTDLFNDVDRLHDPVD